MWDWIVANKEWVFSGIGVVFIGWFLRRSHNNRVTQTQTGGDHSTNIQAGGSIGQPPKGEAADD